MLKVPRARQIDKTKHGDHGVFGQGHILPCDSYTAKVILRKTVEKRRPSPHESNSDAHLLIFVQKATDGILEYGSHCSRNSIYFPKPKGRFKISITTILWVSLSCIHLRWFIFLITNVRPTVHFRKSQEYRLISSCCLWVYWDWRLAWQTEILSGLVVLAFSKAARYDWFVRRHPKPYLGQYSHVWSFYSLVEKLLNIIPRLNWSTIWWHTPGARVVKTRIRDWGL